MSPECQFSFEHSLALWSIALTDKQVAQLPTLEEIREVMLVGL